jgi:hypothetical protein
MSDRPSTQEVIDVYRRSIQGIPEWMFENHRMDKEYDENGNRVLPALSRVIATPAASKTQALGKAEADCGD